MNKKLLAVLSCIMSLGLASFAGCSLFESTSNESVSSEVSSEELPTSEESTCEHAYDNACDVDCN